jgi:predicted ATP-dependent Lon-type protease
VQQIRAKPEVQGTASDGEKQVDGDGEMTSRIETFRLQFDAISTTYVAQASAVYEAFERNITELQTEFAVDMKADGDLYNAVANGCLKTLERKIQEAGL